MQVDKKISKILAVILCFAITFTNIQIPSFADTQYKTTLDGWTVNAVWSDTRDYFYEWDATDTSSRQPKINVSYKIEKAKKDYPVGSVSFTVPGIGNAVRNTVTEGKTAKSSENDSEWLSTWNKESDTYTFTNNFAVKAGESVSGGFELIYNLSARDCINNFMQEKTPTFSIADTGTIVMNPLRYRFTSERDRYRVEVEKTALNGPDYAKSDKSYIWYNMNTRFDSDYLARGLYKSRYAISIELPDDVDKTDLVVKYKGKNVAVENLPDGSIGFYVFKDRYQDLSTNLETGTETFMLGLKRASMDGKKITINTHLDRLYNDEDAWVTEAGENEKVDDTLTFTVESYGFDGKGYTFSINKWNSKYEKDGIKDNHSAPDNYSDRMPSVSIYNGTIVEFSIEGKAQQKYESNRSVRMRSMRRAIATPSEIKETCDELTDWNNIEWASYGYETEVDDSFYTLPTYDDLYANDADQNESILTEEDIEKGRNTEEKEKEEKEAETEEGEEENAVSTPSNIKEGKHENGFLKIFTDMLSMYRITAFADEIATDSNISKKSNNEIREEDSDTPIDINEKNYAMVLGDDVLAITLNNGEIRALEDQEYDFTSVTIPKAEGIGTYELYAADSQNTAFGDYRLLSSGSMEKSSTIFLPSGIKAFFVRIPGLNGDHTFTIPTTVRLHLDYEKEQEKDEALRPDHENIIANFCYMQILVKDENNMEKNVVKDTYLGAFGEKLMERDTEIFGDTVMRDFSHIWLRRVITSASTNTVLTDFSGSKKAGYQTIVTSTGTIKGESRGPLKKFSMYTILPDGLRVNADEDSFDITGFAKSEENGDKLDLTNYAVLSTKKINGKTVLITDVDLTECPAELSNETTISLKFPAYVSYQDYLTHGSGYSIETDLMIHDTGIDNINGFAIRKDEYDLDENGSTNEKIAFSEAVKTITEEVVEWREYALKYVKSAYQEQYDSTAVTRLYNANDTDAQKEKSYYTYKLEYGLGADEVKNIVFYDHIENGTDTPDGIHTESDWTGTIRSIDTKEAEKFGLVPTIYYSKDKNQRFDLSDSGWTMIKPSDLSTVKSIAVSLDTSNLDHDALSGQKRICIYVNMQAPSNHTFIDKTAINQYSVTYDAYDVTGAFKKSYTLLSSSTSVRLLDSIGRITLQKVDSDNILQENADGTKKYAALTGAVIQVYDQNGNAMFPKGGKKVDAFGQIRLENIPHGTYAWEELTAPYGYEKAEGRHTFTVNDETSYIYMDNHRAKGTVTLTKKDADNEKLVLSGASYKLYKDGDDTEIHTDEKNTYSESGAKNTFTTDKDGTLTVSGLPWGTYYFMESEAPEGYETSKERIRFEIGKHTYDEKTGKINVSVTDMDAEKTASVILMKKDEENGNGLRNAYYTLYMKNENGWDTAREMLKTNAVGELIVNGLKFGTYKFKEVMPPAGYKLSKEEPEFTINAKNVENTIKVEHTDERKDGSSVLIKTDDVGTPLLGAEFSLYKEGNSVPVKEHLTTDANGSTPVTEGLSWGRYYYKETKAPNGYVLSSNQFTFTVSADTADIVQKIHVSNSRILGSVTLTKLDEATKSKKLSGAEFSLFKNDGTLVKSGLTTGTDGTVTVQALDWGSYYFEETKAPSGYGISNSKVRFSVNADNCNVLQSVLCYDPVEQAEIKINKSINESYAPFGNATFIFKIKGTDINGVNHTWTRTITMKDGELEGSTRLTGIPVGKYTIEEQSVSRYGLSNLQAVKNVTINGNTATADLTGEKEAEVTFKNDISQYEKFGHATNAVNIVNSGTAITGFAAKYTGKEVLTATDGAYTFSNDNLTGLLFFDDGSSQKINFQDLSVSPSKIDTSYAGGYLVKVTYQKNGITYSDSFTINVTLTKPDGSFTVTYYANGGYFGEDTSKIANQVNYKKGTNDILSGKEMEPNHLTKIFDGWYIDKDCTDGNEFDIKNASSDISVYAKYKDGDAEIDETLYKEALNEQGLLKKSQEAEGKPDSDAAKSAVTINGITFWVKDGILYNYPSAVADDIELAMESLKISNIDITKIHRSMTKPDTEKASTISKEYGEAVYIWKDGNTLYWWSQASHPKLPENSGNLFSNYPNLTDISGLSDFDTSLINDAGGLFKNDKRLSDFSPLSEWNTKNLENAHGMFQFSALTSCDAFSKWNMEKLYSADSMFGNCQYLTNIEGLKNWNAKPHYMCYMFNDTGVVSLNGIDGIDPSRNNARIEGMFQSCEKLTDISALRAWDNKLLNIDKRHGFDSLFEYDSSLSDLTGLEGWNTSKIENMSYMFAGCNLKSLTPLASWNTSSLTDLSAAFYDNKNLETLSGLENWDVRHVTRFSEETKTKGLFKRCSSLRDISALKNWNTENLVSSPYMFYGCYNLSDISALASWNVSNLQNVSNMFSKCHSLSSLAPLSKWDMRKALNPSNMFFACNINTLNGLQNWKLNNATTISGMFGDNEHLTDISALSDWFTETSNVKDMSGLFSSDYRLSDISALKNWKTDCVTNLSQAFENTGITSVEALSSWNTENVTNLSRTFHAVDDLHSLSGLENWNVSNVENFSQAFCRNPYLTDVSAINDWNIISGTDFTQMFWLELKDGHSALPVFTKRKGAWDDNGTFTPE